MPGTYDWDGSTVLALVLLVLVPIEFELMLLLLELPILTPPHDEGLKVTPMPSPILVPVLCSTLTSPTHILSITLAVVLVVEIVIAVVVLLLSVTTFVASVFVLFNVFAGFVKVVGEVVGERLSAGNVCVGSLRDELIGTDKDRLKGRVRPTGGVEG